MGSIKWAIRGARSLAGLIAKPVVPPKLNPMDVIRPPMIRGFNPSANLFAPINKIAVTSTIVAKISLIKLGIVERIAGAQQNTASFVDGLLDPFQWGK